MKKFKILSVVLAFLLVLTVMPTALATNEDFPIFEAIGLNVALEEGKPITRYDLAKIAISLGGLSIVETSKAVYVDVPEKHWAFPEVNTVTYYGYMDGLSDGTFGVDSKATAADAAQILMNLLGYGNFAKQGNWGVAEYYIKARSIGLLDGIEVAADEFDVYDLKTMIVNMLDKNIVLIKSVGTDGIKYEIDERTTYLTSRYGYYFKEGILQAAGKSATNLSSSVGSGKIKVSGVTYSAKGKDYSNYIGSEVRIIVDKNEANAKVLFLEQVKDTNSEELVISSRNILGFSGTTLRYMNDELKAETAEISLSNQMFVNGQKTSFDPKFMNPLSGGLKLVDTNGDKLYDLIFVTYEIYYEVSGAFEDDYIADALTDKRLELDGKEIYLYENGISTGIDSIKNEMIVSVMPGAISFSVEGIPSANNSTLTKAAVEVSVKKVSGVVNAKGAESCVINGVEYEYSKYYRMLMNNSLSIAPELNKYVVAYLNSDNCIVYAKLDVDAIIENQAFKYAYALKMFGKSEISDEVCIKAFTQDAEMLLLETANGYKINGARATAADVFSNTTLFPSGTFKCQLITYELNDEGKVVNIGVAKDNTSAKEADLINFSKDLEVSVDKFRNTVDHLYSFNSSTIYFEIPANLSEEKNFKVKATATPYTNDQACKPILYDLNEKYEAAVVVQVYEKGEGGKKDLKFNHFYGIQPFVIESKMTVLDDEGELRTQYTGLTYSGTDMEVKRLIATEDDLADTDSAGNYKRINQDKLTGTKWKDLNPGDVIHYVLDQYGEVERFRYVFKGTDIKDSEGNTIFADNGNTSIKTTTTYVTTGEVHKIFADGNFLFKAGPNKDLHKASPTAAQAATVMIYIVENDKVKPGKVSDLRIGDPAFFISESGMLYEVIVYRD